MLSHDNRRSLPRGNTLVPSGWQATQIFTPQRRHPRGTGDSKATPGVPHLLVRGSWPRLLLSDQTPGHEVGA
jgi:hypothetical protein